MHSFRRFLLKLDISTCLPSSNTKDLWFSEHCGGDRRTLNPVNSLVDMDFAVPKCYPCKVGNNTTKF